MSMFLGSALFGLVFVLIAPASRAFLAASLGGAYGWLWSWAPLSFILLAIAIAAPFVSIHMVRSAPVHVEPENPMAKYRRDPLDDED